MQANPYSVLGVGSDATVTQVREAYLKLVKQVHPDANRTARDAQQAFERVQAAYELLSDPIRRGRWDEIVRQRAAARASAQSHQTAARSDHNSEDRFGRHGTTADDNGDLAVDTVATAEEWLAAELERLGPRPGPAPRRTAARLPAARFTIATLRACPITVWFASFILGSLGLGVVSLGVQPVAGSLLICVAGVVPLLVGLFSATNPRG